MKKKYVNILIIILARKGSVRIQNKNMKIFNKKPLVGWTIEQSLRINYPNKNVVLSTDSEQIIHYAKKYKNLMIIKRPRSISTSSSSSLLAIQHVLKKIKFSGYVILLQPTSPLRKDFDIENTINFILEGKTPVMSVCKCLHNSSLITSSVPPQKFTPINNKSQSVYYPNGAIYAAHSSWLERNPTFYSKNTYTYLMPEERSIDIDYEYQFDISEMLFKKNNN